MRLRLIHLEGGRRHHCDHLAAWGAKDPWFLYALSGWVVDMETSSLPSRWLRPRVRMFISALPSFYQWIFIVRVKHWEALCMFKYASSIYNTNQEKEKRRHHKNKILTNYLYCKFEGVTHYSRELAIDNSVTIKNRTVNC